MNQSGIVRKPWGQEYLAYHNDEVAIWVLKIEKGKATSLHCHPRKNTAMVVLRGEIELSFIRDAYPHRIFGLDKINIFRGRFHKTRAVSDDVVLLEIEAPDDKRDIVRLEDDYGRASDPIEEATMPLDEDCLQIESPASPGQITKYWEFAGYQTFAGCRLRIVASEQIKSFGSSNVFVTLGGGLERGLVPPGDVIDGTTLARFTRSFKPVPGTSFLHIWKI